MSIEKVTVTDKMELFSDYWSPKVVGALNNQLVKVAKFKGEFVWHHHDNEDELFYVLKGSLSIALRDKTLTSAPGEFVIIPRGVEHKPFAEEEVHVLLFEPASALNTGSTQNDLTQHNLDII